MYIEMSFAINMLTIDCDIDLQTATNYAVDQTLIGTGAV